MPPAERVPGDTATAGVGPVAVIGGGPAGLMAAETLAAAGVAVHVYDAMPSVGRKFLLAGKGGLNLTHAEAADAFRSRYGPRSAEVSRWLDGFGAGELRAWALGLGVETFVGTSGRVFPREMKAAPLLRAWLQRLRRQGVQFHMRHRWLGWQPGDPATRLRFAAPAGEQTIDVRAVVLALGGASWPQLGSDGRWVPMLEARGVAIAALKASNCGFDVGHDGAKAPGWSAQLRERHAGAPVKSVTLAFVPSDGSAAFRRQGEFVITETGIEGSLVYAASAAIRDDIARRGAATVTLDLLPDRNPAQVLAEVAHPRGSRSMASHLKSRLGIAGVKAGLLHEVLPREAMHDSARVAATLKALPLRLVAPRPIAEAISTAGGVLFEALDERLMLRAVPGVYCAGEMIDWEAPTGGYLLTACFASGRRAGLGVAEALSEGVRR